MTPEMLGIHVPISLLCFEWVLFELQGNLGVIIVVNFLGLGLPSHPSSTAGRLSDLEDLLAHLKS